MFRLYLILFLFRTGYLNIRKTIQVLLGSELANYGPVTGFLDDEGELEGVWRPSGHPAVRFGLWVLLIQSFMICLAMVCCGRIPDVTHDVETAGEYVQTYRSLLLMLLPFCRRFSLRQQILDCLSRIYVCIL